MHATAYTNYKQLYTDGCRLTYVLHAYIVSCYYVDKYAHNCANSPQHLRMICIHALKCVYTSVYDNLCVISASAYPKKSRVRPKILVKHNISPGTHIYIYIRLKILKFEFKCNVWLVCNCCTRYSGCRLSIQTSLQVNVQTHVHECIEVSRILSPNSVCPAEMLTRDPWPFACTNSSKH